MAFCAAGEDHVLHHALGVGEEALRFLARGGWGFGGSAGTDSASIRSRL